MNSNELASELEKCIKDGSTDLVCVDQAATMLRQQHAELTQLKNLLLDNQILLDKTLNAWAKEMERRK